MPNTSTERALAALRGLILAGENYRHAVADRLDLGVTETQAMSYLLRDGDLGQSDLASRLSLTTGAVTALVDRLERADVAVRTAHASDRRRSVVQLTDRGRELAEKTATWTLRAFDEIEAADLPAAVEVLESLTRGLDRQARLVAQADGAL